TAPLECSNLAGIAYVYQEALERETGLTPGEIRSASAELEKAGFVVFDQGVAWVKDQLATDPRRENDPARINPTHRPAIESILGSLPRGSIAVKKFRDYVRGARAVLVTPRFVRLAKNAAHRSYPHSVAGGAVVQTVL